VTPVPHPPGAADAENPPIAGLSADGSMVLFQVRDGTTYDVERWIWTAEDGLELQPPLLAPTDFDVVSPDGSTTGGSSKSVLGLTAAAKHSTGTGLLMLGNLPPHYGVPTPGSTSLVTGLSHDGSHAAVQQYPAEPDLHPYASLWVDGAGYFPLALPSSQRLTRVLAISGNGYVTGGYTGAPTGGSLLEEQTACVWTNGEEFLLPQDVAAAAVVALNHEGTVAVGVAEVLDAPGRKDLFAWSLAEGYRLLGVASLGDSHAVLRVKGLSLDGRRIVGYRRAEGLDVQGWIWDSDEGVRTVQDVLESHGHVYEPGSWTQACMGISADGQTIAFDVANARNAPVGQTYVARLPATRPVMRTDTDRISCEDGGVQTMTLEAGAAHAGRFHLVLGSFAGTFPGISDGFRLPLNPDPYMEFLFLSPGSVVAGSFGVLDGSGRSTASITLTPGTFVELAGRDLFHAYVVVDDALDVVGASNATLLRLTP
jgi:hypothetical protein